jgi:hypothetical protein
VNGFKSLYHKLHCTAKALRSSSQKFISNIRLQLAIAIEVIFKLDQAQDDRALSLSITEAALCKELKFRCLGIASLSRTIARQWSRLTCFGEGDANTKFFHLQAYHRSKKNLVDQL